MVEHWGVVDGWMVEHRAIESWAVECRAVEGWAIEGWVVEYWAVQGWAVEHQLHKGADSNPSTDCCFKTWAILLTKLLVSFHSTSYISL